MKETTYRTLMETRPEFALEHAVKGMLPKNSLGRQMIKKLKVYAGPVSYTHLDVYKRQGFSNKAAEMQKEGQLVQE